MKKYTVEQLEEMVREASSWNGSLSEYEMYENDEEFFANFFANDAYGALKASHFGSYNVHEAYVNFDAYGNLNSFSEWEYNELLEDNAEEIVAVATELNEEGEIDFSHILDAEEEAEEE